METWGDPPLVTAYAESGSETGATNLYYPPGDLRRYGGDPTGASNSRTALANAAASAAVLSVSVIVAAGVYKIDTSNITVSAPILFATGGRLRPTSGIA